MDSAVTELLSAENSSHGVLSWFYEVLRQPMPHRTLAQCRYRQYLPHIPPTVLFNYSRAQGWYESYLVPLTDEEEEALARLSPSSSTDNKLNSSKNHPSPTRSEAPLPSSSSSPLRTSSLSSPHQQQQQSQQQVVGEGNGSANNNNISTNPKDHSNKANNNASSSTTAAGTTSTSPPRTMVVEYRKRKPSDLTTHQIVAAICPSFKVLAQKVTMKEKERNRAGNSSSPNKPPTSSTMFSGIGVVGGMRQYDYKSGGSSSYASGSSSSSSSSSAHLHLNSFAVAMIAQQLPKGRICAQTICKANIVSSDSRHQSSSTATSSFDVNASGGGNASRLQQQQQQQRSFELISKHAEPPSGAEAAVQYYDEHELGQLLFHDTIDYAILQRFSHPSSSSSAFSSNDDVASFNQVLIAHWQPNYCFVTRTTSSMFPLNDTRRSTQLRGDVSDPRTSTDKGASNVGWNVQRALMMACNALAERVYFATNGIRLRKMSVVFKIEGGDKVARGGRIVLQWCQSAAVAKGPSVLTARDDVVAKLPFSSSSSSSSATAGAANNDQHLSGFGGTDVGATLSSSPSSAAVQKKRRDIANASSAFAFAADSDNDKRDLIVKKKDAKDGDDAVYSPSRRKSSSASGAALVVGNGLVPIPRNFVYGVNDVAEQSDKGEEDGERSFEAEGDDDDGEATNDYGKDSSNRTRGNNSPQTTNQRSISNNSPHRHARRRNSSTTTIQGRNGVNVRVNPQAQEVKKLMDEAFGPARPRGLLTRTKLDFIDFQLHENQHNQSPPRGGGVLLGDRKRYQARSTSRFDLNAGDTSASSSPPPTTLDDVLRVGLEEMAKDALFESLAPRAWTHRTPSRRAPSVHNLLALRESRVAEEAQSMQRTRERVATMQRQQQRQQLKNAHADEDGEEEGEDALLLNETGTYRHSKAKTSKKKGTTLSDKGFKPSLLDLLSGNAQTVTEEKRRRDHLNEQYNYDAYVPFVPFSDEITKTTPTTPRRTPSPFSSPTHSKQRHHQQQNRREEGATTSSPDGWAFAPSPRSDHNTSKTNTHATATSTTGGGNVWADLSSDAALPRSEEENSARRAAAVAGANVAVDGGGSGSRANQYAPLSSRPPSPSSPRSARGGGGGGGVGDEKLSSARQSPRLGPRNRSQANLSRIASLSNTNTANQQQQHQQSGNDNAIPPCATVARPSSATSSSGREGRAISSARQQQATHKPPPPPPPPPQQDNAADVEPPPLPKEDTVVLHHSHIPPHLMLQLNHHKQKNNKHVKIGADERDGSGGGGGEGDISIVGVITYTDHQRVKGNGASPTAQQQQQRARLHTNAARGLLRRHDKGHTDADAADSCSSKSHDNVDDSNGNGDDGDVVAEYINSRTWGRPSKVDSALLLPLDRDEPFSINRIAADAGRLGHREAYLSTMRSGGASSASGRAAVYRRQ